MTKKPTQKKKKQTNKGKKHPQMDAIQKRARIKLAKHDFWVYCQVKAPDFYKRTRKHLQRLCRDLQAFVESDDVVCIVEAPPRHGKSRTVSMLSQWMFGRDPTMKIMTGSYNETLSTTFSKGVRNAIQEEKADADVVVYSDIFPNVQIRKGDGAMNLWALEGGYYNYLATSPTGTATGFGANLMIIDDLIKNDDEAYNENILNDHWDWFTNTMLSRLEEGGKIIIIMTRWATKDLAGRALAHFTHEGRKVRHITMQALQEDGTMLCDEILSYASYQEKVRAMGIELASANYQQKPVDLEGQLYKGLQTYEQIPLDHTGHPLFEKVIAYTDTADDGADYLCSLVAGVYQGKAYMLDCYYTKDGMEITEPNTAEMMVKNNVGICIVESNSGGRGFARNVERLIRQEHKTYKVKMRWFHQHKNKKARILSNSNTVMQDILFPVDWETRWADFARAIKNYQKSGRNATDDAPDALTGIAENIEGRTAKAVQRI